MEQDDYTTEEINWSYVEFVDNQDVLDLIEKVPSFWQHTFLSLYFNSTSKTFDDFASYVQKPGGIIALLDEAW